MAAEISKEDGVKIMSDRPENARRGRAAALEFFEDHVHQHLFNSSNQLSTYMKNSFNSKPKNGEETTALPRRTVFILEDISTDFVEVLGFQLQIEPMFFAQQLWQSTWDNNRMGRKWFSLQYPQLLSLNDDTLFEANGKLYCDSNVFRKFSLPGASLGLFDRVAVIHRRLSYWSEEDTFAILLVDPPVGTYTIPNWSAPNRCSIPTPQKIPVACSPYEGGYVDVLKWPKELIGTPASWDTAAAQVPPRTSLLDDILFYYRETQQLNHQTTGCIADLTKKIALSNWTNFQLYVRKHSTFLEYKLEEFQETHGSKKNFTGLQWLEQNIDHVNGWKRRCAHYCDYVETNLVELNVTPPHSLDMSTQTTNLNGCLQDWVILLGRLRMWKDRTAAINSAVLNHLSILESSKSLDEARNSRLLAVLGTIFLPLSLTSSILSMGGDFLPGNRKFWIYFAVSLPLLVLGLLFSFGTAAVAEKARVVNTRFKQQSLPMWKKKNLVVRW
ncbi:hypothetical protein OIDMADRAFT_141113 [Oidiodendron maius Zn]|uniref:Uncharacterized protein n=1 Tax=Oidiodendron maius (strain Zn) TaxID=913774 RepID=A0A0C3I379_OIDMZ|nr:hypothetical protein OIDMADRAFT_141113 [Oidiodendron maius Zn]